MFQVLGNIALIISILLGIALTIGVMFMQSKSEGMGGILGGTSNISSRGIKGIDEQYRGMISNIGWAWLVAVAVSAFFMT